LDSDQYTEYLKLLRLEEELKTKNQTLSLNERKQIPEYNCQIVDHFRWQEKNNFIEVMSNFLENKISLDQYIDQFWETEFQSQANQQKLVSDFKRLERFNPDVRSVGFARLIENLLSDIRLLEKDESIRTSDELSPGELIEGIEEFLPKIKQY
jgi:hypothetical protein